MKDILVLAEHRNQELEPITLQLIGKGREVADKLGVKLSALILGSKVNTLAEALQSKGVDTVLVADHPALESYNPEIYCKVISDIIGNIEPALFFLGYTYLGMEIGPAIASKQGCVLASNCVDLELVDGAVIVTRPMYNGVTHVKLELQGAQPFIISFQTGTLPAKPLPQRPTSVLVAPVEIGDTRIRVLSLLEPETGDIDITKADIIVAVGRGIGGEANIQLAKDLAVALGGVVACSRPVADLGWMPAEYHTGISGKTVKPKVYIACGISGASQHVAGIKDSKVIIAINKDPDAPMFHVARYGIVGDLLKIMPSLIEEARALSGQR
ncbi:electron transfer flavoprotein subunit alpha/FixB family protein [Chloroflexota bacterium]